MEKQGGGLEKKKTSFKNQDMKKENQTHLSKHSPCEFYRPSESLVCAFISLDFSFSRCVLGPLCDCQEIKLYSTLALLKKPLCVQCYMRVSLQYTPLFTYPREG